MSGRLTDGFREVIEIRWSEFLEREQSFDATNFDAIICAIVRACAKGNLRAIQQALDRLDGKVATEIDVEYPKFYTVYPRAIKAADDPTIVDVNEKFLQEYPLTAEQATETIGSPADVDEQEAVEEELPTGSLRAVLDRMLNSPKSIVTDILAASQAVEENNPSYGNPMVKSVVVAGLMKLVHDGRISAVFEIFNQIDGKVAETYKVLGNDVYMKNYALIAPAGAVKNQDGMYQIEAEITTNSWVAKLEAKNKKGR